MRILEWWRNGKTGFYKSLRGHTYLGDANFAEIAHAFGVKSECIRKPGEIMPALNVC